MIELEFAAFPHIRRLSRECIVTEKIDGTNALVWISDNGRVRAGSRNRFISVESDNYGFAKWVKENESELIRLGVGNHYGEWWGRGIRRGYSLNERRFSLFNTSRWTDETKPGCCHIAPVLYRGTFDTAAIDAALDSLRAMGSSAAPGFDRPEGVVVYHVAAGVMLKKTLGGDGHKSA
jgi:hypothetical protein